MCHSPKRKRDTTNDPSDLALVPSSTRLRISNPPTRPAAPLDDDDSNGDRSPRSNVAGHFQNLNLTGYGFEFEKKAMEKPFVTPCAVANSQGSHHPLTTHESSSQSSEPQPLSPTTTTTFTTRQPKEFPLEIPETPRLQPTTAMSSVPSPLPRPKSPPPLNLWWADAEITGHDPTDPADDGYGINGVGFLPTPAIARARAEGRKRQVAEWKNREARDARQRRSEARRRREQEMHSQSRTASEGDLGGRQQRRVRFLEV
ncbi:MAG: hypothetical protein LQ345_002873 [Seirophora villosa]|nr:MAG: hypothetical protein LQ345_002873 [Seirophora villosa]